MLLVAMGTRRSGVTAGRCGRGVAAAAALLALAFVCLAAPAAARPATAERGAAVRKLGPAKGFYGARVSGGGSGGTVVVLLQKAALPTLRRLAAKIRFSSEPLGLIL